MRKKTWGRGIAFVLTVVILFYPKLAVPDAMYITYTIEFMNKWNSVCNCLDNTINPLSYCDEQAYGFHDRLSGYGDHMRVMYGNTSTWACDATEDRDFGGCDNFVADFADLYLLSSHGIETDNTWGEDWEGLLCNTPGVAGCTFSIEDSRLGEYWGNYSTPEMGEVKYLVLHACLGVNRLRAHEQWNQTFAYGMHYVMGFHGVSTDSYWTQDVPKIFAGKALSDRTWSFDNAWYTASDRPCTTDWPAVVTFDKYGPVTVTRRLEETDIDDESGWYSTPPDWNSYSIPTWYVFSFRRL